MQKNQEENKQIQKKYSIILLFSFIRDIKIFLVNKNIPLNSEILFKRLENWKHFSVLSLLHVTSQMKAIYRFPEVKLCYKKIPFFL